MVAACSSSGGSERMNWTIRKTKKASVARNFGTTSGRMVFTQPIFRKKMYCGMSCAWIGSMIDPSISENHSHLRRKFRRAKA